MLAVQTPPPDLSPIGRRVLVARVTGPVGEKIQTWRQEHDPAQARRLRPHATLCYQPALQPVEAIEAQVRYAFPAQIRVWLGGVHELPNKDGTLVVRVTQTDALEDARLRLFDARFAVMDGHRTFPWHITVVRYPRRGDLSALQTAGAAFHVDAPWDVDTISYLELQNGRYESLAEWMLPGKTT